MSEDTEEHGDAPDAELDEILAATASDRRSDGLKMLGGAIAALGLSAVFSFVVGGDSGEVSRVLVLIVTYGSLFLGILLSIFGLTLIVNSVLVEP